jgi:hypothetical protein
VAGTSLVGYVFKGPGMCPCDGPIWHKVVHCRICGADVASIVILKFQDAEAVVSVV